MSEQPSKRVNLSLDPRLIILLLLAVIAVMLALWRPWQSSGISDRTIDVTGEAKVTAEPDEFTFYPSYQYQNANKDAALSEATKKHEEVIAKLKELGIADNKIKSDTSGFDAGGFRPLADGGQTTYSSSIQVVVNSRELAQKVQDYLVTTAPLGAVSPNATFSDAKRKELENKARDEAVKDARTRAEQSAKNLGAKIGKVKAVADGAGFSNGSAARDTVRTLELGAASPALAVQPGENELTYTVEVTYYLN